MKERRAGVPITLGGMTLVPIEQVRIHFGQQSAAYWLRASKEPLAVVICDVDGPRAVDVEGREVPVDGLIADIPGLEVLLAQWLST